MYFQDDKPSDFSTSRHLSWITGGGILTISVWVMAGWLIGFQEMTCIIPGTISMKFNTALCFALIGLAMILIQFPISICLFVSRALALLCGVIGLISFIEFSTSRSFGIDEFFVRDIFVANATPYRGQMAPATGLGFVLCSIGLWLMAASAVSRRSPVPLLAIVILVVFLTQNAFISYLSGLPFDTPWGQFMSIAYSSDILLFLFSCGALAHAWLHSSVPLSLSWKWMIPPLVIFLLVPILTIYSTRGIARAFDASRQTAIIEKYEVAIEQLLNLINEDQSGLRGYLLTKDPRYLPLSDRASAEIGPAFQNLASQTDGNSKLEILDQQLKVDLDRHARFRATFMEDLKKQGFDGVVNQSRQMEEKLIVDSIRNKIREIKVETTRILQIEKHKEFSVTQTVLSILPGCMLFIIMLLNLGMLIVFWEASLREKILRELDVTLNRLRFVMVSGGIGEWSFEPVTGVAEHSASHDEIFGYSTPLANWSMNDFLNHLPSEERERIEKLIEKEIKSGLGFHFETKILRADGTPGWIWVQARIDRDEHGNARQVYGLVGDMTKRKLAEENLAIKESFQKAILDSAVTAIVATDLKGIVTLFNPEAERAFGYDSSEIVGKKTPALWHDQEEVRNQARALSSELGCTVTPGFEVFSTLATHGKKDAGEWTFVRKDGTRFLGLLSLSTLIDHSGAVTGYLGLMRDITLLRRTEENLSLSEVRVRMAAAAGRIGVWDWIMKDGALLLDSNFCTIYGIPYREGYTFNISEWKEWVHPEDLEEQLRLLLLMAQTQNPDFSHRQFRIIRQTDKAVRTIDASTAAIPGPDGTTIRLVGTNMDITDSLEQLERIKSLNGELKQRAAELEISVKELDAFSYSVSHDLRAPLRAIDGFSKLLEEEYSANLNEEAHHYIEVVRGETKRMGRLIDDLLAFSRMGRARVEPITIDMQALANDVFRELMGQESGRTIHFTIGELPTARGTLPMIRQVWVNLLGNAIKFTKGKDPTEISVESMQDEKGETVYRIRDNGAGFDMRHVGKLFGVFQRLHSNEEFPGTGVGLALVQRIIHRHGGNVWGEGEVGKGAIFSFTLPEQGVGRGFSLPETSFATLPPPPTPETNPRI
jgi:PAS domain S-box-containing protein